jgi:hypothetical protein
MRMTRKVMICGAMLTIGSSAAWGQGASSGSSGGSMGGSGGASDGTATAPPGGGSADNVRTVTMTVKQVNPSAHKVTLDVQVKPETNITSSGQPIRIDQLKPGDQVRASFDVTTGEMTELQVTKKSPKGAPSSQ